MFVPLFSQIPARPVLCAALALIMSLSACTVSIDTEDCTGDDDCDLGYACTDDGLCRTASELECVDDRDCPRGYDCSTQRGVCQVGLIECSGDTHCPPHYVCSDYEVCELGELSCTTDTDCPDGYACATSTQLCLDTSAQCQVDEDCIDVFGDGATCSDDGFCDGETDLTAGPCQQLYGPVEHEEVFLVGVVMQLSGVGGGFGRPMLDSIRIAKRDFNALGGVFHAVREDDDDDEDDDDLLGEVFEEVQRPIGIIACDTEARDDIAAQAAEHLVHQAGVEAIIGFNSSQVIDIVPTITAPQDVLVMSPSATATTVPSSEYFWRTAPSDEAQGTALTNLVEFLATDHLPAQGVDSPHIARLVRSQDQWSQGLRDALDGDLPGEITAEGRYYPYSFPNVGAGDVPDYAPVAADIAAEDPQPDLVVVLGSADSWQVIDYIDSALDGEPIFVGADAMKNVEQASQASSELEHRIWGTGPRTAAEIGHAPYTIFRLRFEEEMNDSADNYQFVANAFDALYTIAFAASAEGFTGPDISRGLARLSSGPEIQPRSSDINQAFDILADDGSIDYVGASGPINFDESGDPEPLPIALWCFEEGQIPERGQLYEPDSGQFTSLTCDPE